MLQKLFYIHLFHINTVNFNFHRNTKLLEIGILGKIKVGI